MFDYVAKITELENANMIINQMLLAVKLLFVAFVMEITRRIVTGVASFE